MRCCFRPGTSRNRILRLVILQFITEHQDSERQTMSMTQRELWTVLHGMCLGGLFLLAFGGGLTELWSLQGQLLNAAGIQKCVRRLIAGTWVMAVVAWLTVISGTYLVYPWYRAKPPVQPVEAVTSPVDKVDLTHYPRAYLLASPNTNEWHSFGMEWKEHIAWFSPILATAVAFAISRYRRQLAHDKILRWSLMTLFVLSFATAAVAGVLGAFINKVAPLH